MIKRKITDQQKKRIASLQAEKAASLHTGLVIANFGKRIEVELDSKIINCQKRQNLPPLVPGDNVSVDIDESFANGVVVALQPRNNLLNRPDSRGILHAVAANIDRIFIVMAAVPAPSLTTIDRYLIAAKQQNIEPIIILNKEDLITADNRQEILSLLDIYQKIGIQTATLSAKKLQHLSLLHSLLTHKRSVFVGQSGVGKSSIIATLLPNINIAVQDISSNIKQGKHTTTTARLYHLETLDADIIDSPGMREFPLWQIDLKNLASGFVEFIPYLNQCKFKNCLHLNEPGCAIIIAAEEQQISTQRLHSYQQILKTMQEKQTRG